MTANQMPIEIDPRPCEWCGLTIDQHHMVDDGEGPEFFCEEIISADAADIVQRWELSDPRDSWRHTGEPRPRVQSDAEPRRQPYRTPQSTTDAFLYVLRLDDAPYLARWLRQHPADAPFLMQIYEAKHARA